MVSAGSDLLVKLDVTRAGALRFTDDGDTTRYIDLNDPDNPETAGANAGKNPRGIVITEDGETAYVTNFVSRNVSVVDLTSDEVVAVIPAPEQGSADEVVQVGAEMFFSSRGHFDRARRHGLDRRAALERGLAGLRELPLRGPDRRRGLGVRRRPAQVGAAQRHLQPRRARTSNGS